MEAPWETTNPKPFGVLLELRRDEDGNLQVGRLVDTQQAVRLSPGWCEWWDPENESTAERDRQTYTTQQGWHLGLPAFLSWYASRTSMTHISLRSMTPSA